MVIDPRRSSRGHAERFVVSRKLLAFTAVAVAGHAPVAAYAQLALPDVGPGTYGAPWRFSAGVSLDETWSDNINLAPAGLERSEFVTSISPSFTASRSGPRITAQLAYTPQYIYYARGTNGAALRNSLNASMNARVIENLLFFDAAANISQQNISPFGTLAANTVNGSTNRAETRSYSFGPTLRSRLQQDVTYQLGARYTFSNSDSSAYAANRTSSVFGDIQTSTSFRDVAVGLSFNRTDQEYNETNAIVVESVNGTLTYLLQPTFRLRGSVGYDRTRYPTFGQADLAGLSYSGGFDWNPSQHTSLSAQVGHRYFGPTANVQLRESRTRWAASLSYTRDQTTSAGNGLTLTQDPNYALLDQFYRTTITDPVARALAVTNALSQAGLSTSPYATSSFFSNQLYVQKALTASLALFGLRNTVTFDASRTESQGLSNITVGFDIFAQTSRFRTTSYSANWSHRLGPRTSVNATVSHVSSRALSGTGDTRQRQFVASVNRQVSRLVSASALYRNTAQVGSGTPGTNFYGGNYRENAVLASVRVNF